MTIYVDNLESWGWVIRGRRVDSCHMFTDTVDLTELHEMAEKIGMRKAWFQDKPRTAPHYDLVESRRIEAVKLGAVELNRHQSAAIRKLRRELLKESNVV